MSFPIFTYFYIYIYTPLSEYTIYDTKRYIFLSASTSAVQNLLLLYMYQSSYDTMSMILFTVHCILHIKHTHTHLDVILSYFYILPCIYTLI